MLAHTVMHKTPPQGSSLATKPRRLLLACFPLALLTAIGGCGIGISNPPDAPVPIAPALSWAPLVSSLPYGTPLTTGVLDAVSNVPGSFVYSTGDGQILNPSTTLTVGAYSLFATFTPQDAQHYTGGSIRIAFQVGVIPASVSWTPSTNTISQGVPLVPAILDALGSVDGTMAYTATSNGVVAPITSDTVLPAGRYTLTATLTPFDSSRFGPGSRSISVTVFVPPQVISATSSAALEQGYNGKFVIDNNGTSYFSIHSADGAGNLNNALVESVGIWNLTSQFTSIYLRNYGPVNVEGSPQGAASLATNGDGTVHMVWAGSDVPILDAAYANQIRYARFNNANPPAIQEETIPFSVDGFAKYYSLPYQREFLWQEHPSFAEDSAGKLYIVFEGRDPTGAPTVTCPIAPGILAGGADGFRRSPLPSADPLPVSLTVAPTSVSLLTCQTQQFTATVTNSTNQFVDWQVNGLVGGNSTTGTISKTGLYTAPASVPTPSRVGITADSQADPTKTATALVTLNAPLTAPAVLPLSSGIALVTRAKDGTYSQSGIITAPPYLGVQGYTTQLRPQIMVQSAAIQHLICTGSGPGVAKQQILYGTISSGIFSGWQPVSLSRNDQQNQSAVLDSAGQIHLVWREVAQGQNSMVLYSVRSVKGVWSAPVQISSPSLYADTPSISVDSQVVRAAWVEWKPGFINSDAQINNGLSATTIEDTHVVEGTLTFSMKSLGPPNAPFSAPVIIQTGGVVGYPTFARGVPNALAWTTFAYGIGHPTAWSVYVGETP